MRKSVRKYRIEKCAVNSFDKIPARFFLQFTCLPRAFAEAEILQKSLTHRLNPGRHCHRFFTVLTLALRLRLFPHRALFALAGGFYVFQHRLAF
jgi:hypothetical protein